MLHNLYPMCCIEISSIPVLYPPLEMLSYDRVLHGDEEFFDSYIQNAVQSIDLCNFFPWQERTILHVYATLVVLTGMQYKRQRQMNGQ